MDKDLQNISNGMATAEEKLLQFFKTALPYVVLVVSVAFTVVKSLFTFGIVNPFSSEFWISLGGNILTTILTYSAFCIHGSQEYKETNKPYIENCKAWGEYSAQIRKLYPTEFLNYCKDYAAKCALAKRKATFEKRSLIPWEVVERDFLPLRANEIRKAYLDGKIDKRDYTAIIKARRATKPPTVSATAILCGSDSVSVENISTVRRNYVAKTIFLRPFMMAAFSAGFAVVNPVFTGVSSAVVIFSIISSIFLILVSAVTGNTAGNNGARREAADVKAKIYFLDTFMKTIKA